MAMKTTATSRGQSCGDNLDIHMWWSRKKSAKASGSGLRLGSWAKLRLGCGVSRRKATEKIIADFRAQSLMEGEGWNVPKFADLCSKRTRPLTDLQKEV